jgi:hypothetical protein
MGEGQLPCGDWQRLAVLAIINVEHGSVLCF